MNRSLAGWKVDDLTRLAVGTAEVVVNEAGADVDFRVEGDTATKLLLADAGLDAVQIGGTVAGDIADFRAATVVLNEDGSDQDLRVEGDTATSLLVLDAGLDAFQVGTTTAGTLLDLRGTASVFNEAGADIDLRIEGDTDANLLYVDAGADSVGIGIAAPLAWLHLKTGTTAKAALLMPSGQVLTSPVAGAFEYDGANLSFTENTTSGRTISCDEHIFELNGNGTSIGNGIADFFGATSSISLPASSRWELEAHLYYLKSTAGTVVYTITNSAANYTNIAAKYVQSPAAGIATNAATTGAAVVTSTTAATALPATASLTDATNHFAILHATIDMNAAGNIRIRCTESAGTITPLRGSFYKIRRLPASSGVFAA